MATATTRSGAHATSHLARRFTAAAESIADTFRLWQRRARERAELERWEDRDLRDAGLSRAVVHNELAKPFWRG